MDQSFDFEGGYTQESWEYARSFAYVLGPLPSSFTSVIRLLMTDHDKDPKALSELGRFFAGRLLKTPSMQAPYYYAIKFFKPELLEDPEKPFEVNDYLDSFTGYEHAALLATVFLHRHSRKLCDAEMLGRITPRLQQSLNLGWLVGNAIPAIGSGAGLMLGGFRVFGFLPFLKHDPENFREYLDHLDTSLVAVDMSYELQLWRCNCLQVALMMCQQLGFGIKRIIPLMKAVTTTSPLITSDEFERVFRALDVWMESVARQRAAPSIPMPPKFYPSKNDLDWLLRRYGLLMHTDDANWLTRRREDLTPETTPQLFVNGMQPGFAFDNDVPTDLEGALPDDTINELSNKLLQDFMAEEADDPESDN